ncbi:MAG TPA: RHS repeat-associated core domain-containing protein [Solirubrobacteraceae bacterium]|nr:RHS repeat-associated core domain-containing protein [Solirubrobacteraceae bacterium]
MGYAYDEVSNSRAYNENTFSSGPTNPFGSATKDSEQASIYATYTLSSAPANTSPPTITGIPMEGNTLTEHHGSWTHEPTSYSYQWRQCNSSGNSCTSISGATSQTYAPVAGDVGHTLRVEETATNASGSGRTASSAIAVLGCTDSWTGPSEANWQIASDWSAEHVPNAGDVACIGAGKTVVIASGTNQSGVVQGEGRIAISGGFGSLELTNSLGLSSIHSLLLAHGGTLTGAATLKVTGSLTWSGGRMSGSGSTILASGASGSEEGGEEVFLSQRTFVNEGTFTLASGHFGMGAGAQVKNSGTFNANGAGTTIASESSGAPALFINTGTFQKNVGSELMQVDSDFENRGTVNGVSATIAFADESKDVVLASKSVLKGAVRFEGANVTAGSFTSPSGTISLVSKTMTVTSGSTATVANFVLSGISTTLSGAGAMQVSGSLTWQGGIMSGSGATIVMPGATASKEEPAGQLLERTLINEGTFKLNEPAGAIQMGQFARLENIGTFDITEGTPLEAIGSLSESLFVNTGTFQKTDGSDTYVEAFFENQGIVQKLVKSSNLRITYPVVAEPSTEWGGEENPRQQTLCDEADSVSCATGNMSQTETDFAVGGRGVGLNLTRTYNSQAAVAGVHGIFGYGWSSSFTDHLVLEPSGHHATLVRANGSTIPFAEGSGGAFTAPAWTQDTLSGSGSSGYALTEEDQTVLRFAGSGRLESVTDRNNNATTLAYGGGGHLETITDPTGRTIKLTYNSEGLVEAATDPMKYVVKYTYEAGNLASVSQPNKTALRWQFKNYDSSHEIQELVDGRGGKTNYEYSSAHQVVKQTDPIGRATTFEYGPFRTQIRNQATGAEAVQYFTSADLPCAVTRGYGTSSATTESKTYDTAGDLLSLTDGNSHTTKYGYDGHANRTSLLDPVGNETKWTYDSKHDVETETKPNKETKTYKRDSHGNPEAVERPAPGSTTQITKYAYDSHGSQTSMEDPLKRVWKYEYDGAGDRTAEIDPEGDKRTWGYNEDSQETSMVSPKGHVEGAEEATYKTTTERDAEGRPIKVTDPLGNETKTTYDGDGNVEVKTDPEGHETAYTYDADNEQTKVKEPNGAVTETGYDGAGQVTSHTDANKHATKYERNILEQITEVIDPLSRKTLKEYDAAGNVTQLTDQLKRTTTYKYDSDNHLTEVSYSDGKTHAASYEYDNNGDRTKMTDGTGTTTYEYDELGRLTETKDGHGNRAGYEYDLANEQTNITYPNGKTVTREYDSAGRLKKVTDWSGHATKFAYDVDGNLRATTFPSGTSNEDTYAYDATDAMKEVKMTKGTETLASLVYTRNKDGQVKGVTSKGLPGEEKPAYTYDANRRLEKGGPTGYKYDEANNPTEIGSLAYSYDAADELEKGTGFSYSYNEVGQRIKTKPASGPATSYGYDQAGNLTTVARPHEGEVSAIEDSYGYNGDGLRTSQTISGATTYMAWNTAEKLPLVLSDGANSYVYGPNGLPVEQIATAGSVLYLHHDQQGSTRMLTGASGESVGTTTYDAYGNVLGRTGVSASPLGYDGQYTDTDTGLIYLRARYYDPTTAQLLTVDPAVESTLEPYTYARDDPANRGDPTGKDSPAPEEIAFTNNYTQVRRATGRRLNGGTREDFEAAANYYYFAVITEIAMNNHNLSYATYDLARTQELYAQLSERVLSKFAPLIKAETTTGWTGVIKSFIALVKRSYHIRVFVRPFSYG